MGAIRGMMASSLDGYAAASDGSVAFLAPFEGVDWGYDAFAAEIGTVVMGRHTWSHIRTLSPQWPYPGKRALIVGRGLEAPLGDGAEIWSDGVPALVARLRAEPQDAWIVGGPMLQGAVLG